jgi:hypothetical protein
MGTRNHNSIATTAKEPTLQPVNHTHRKFSRPQNNPTPVPDSVIGRTSKTKNVIPLSNEQPQMTNNTIVTTRTPPTEVKFTFHASAGEFHLRTHAQATLQDVQKLMSP